MFDFLFPGGVFGCPFHGLSREGTLTLPNAATKVWTQPTGGDTNLIACPGLTAPSRSVAEQAADAADGLTWSHRAVLAGTDRHVMGREITGWVMFDATRRPWLVTTNLEGQTLQDGVSATITIAPFCWVVPSPPSPQTIYAFQTDVQQDTPTIDAAAWHSIVDGEGGELVLVAVSPNGRKAAFAGRVTVGTGETTLTTAPTEVELGFLELEITESGGEFSATLTVLASRATTLGTYDGGVDEDTDNSDTYPTGTYYHFVQETAGDTLIQTTSWPTVDSGTSDSGGQHDGADYNNDHLVTYDEVTGRVIGVWYDEDNAAQLITMDVRRESGLRYVAAREASGSIVVIRDAETNEIISETGSLSASWSSTQDTGAHGSITFHVGDRELVVPIVISQRFTSTAEDSQASIDSGITWGDDVQNTVSYAQVGAFSESATPGSTPLASMAAAGDLDQAGQREYGLRASSWLIAQFTDWEEGIDRRYGVFPHRYSNNLFGVRYELYEEPAETTEHGNIGAVTPWDDDDTTVKGPFEEEYPNGSADPLTGEMVWGEIDAVCYV